MRYFTYFLTFMISFIFFFAYNFPVREVFGGFLSKNGISYKSIKGNLFTFKIKELEYKNFRVEDIKIKNSIFKIYALINKKQKLYIYPFSKSAKIKLKNLKLENYQIKPQVFGNLNTKNVNIKLKRQYILISSNLQLFLSKTNFPFVNNIKISVDIKPEENFNNLKANISSQNINGAFNGKVYLPVNISQGKVEGIFSGEIFNSQVNKNISIKFKNLLSGRFRF